MRTLLLLLPLAFSLSCAKRPEASPDQPPKPKAFKGEVYKSSAGHTITMISSDELEITDDGTNLVCKYTKQDDVIRIVMNRLGTTEAVYYRVRPDGLQDPKGNTFYSSAGIVNKTRIDICSIASAYQTYYVDFHTFYLLDAPHVTHASPTPRALDDRTDGARPVTLLRQALSPLYIRSFPEADLYGNQYGLRITDQGKRFSITSVGTDHRPGGGDDFVFEGDGNGGGSFTTVPSAATKRTCS